MAQRSCPGRNREGQIDDNDQFQAAADRLDRRDGHRRHPRSVLSRGGAAERAADGDAFGRGEPVADDSTDGYSRTNSDRYVNPRPDGDGCANPGTNSHPRTNDRANSYPRSNCRSNCHA